jgi:Protein of unknown function (DUF2490)
MKRKGLSSLSANFLKQVYLLAALIMAFTSLQAQSDWLSWNTITVSSDLAKKWKASIGHSRVYKINNQFNNSFNQSQYNITYQLSKKWSLQTGAQLTNSPDAPEFKKRIFLRVALNNKLFKVLSLTNSIRAEYNTLEETRFRERVILATRLALRKRLHFLNIQPSVSYSLYYNIGGNRIKYFDKSATLLAQHSPDGFHRGRLTFTLQSKINKLIFLSMYYMKQEEFNLLSSWNRKMNVPDPTRNRTLRPFNNFNAAGLTLEINLSPLFKH